MSTTIRDYQGDHGGDRAYTVRQTRERLGGISQSFIYGLIRGGRLHAVKIGTRTLVRQSEIDRFLASLPAAVTGDE